MRSYDALIVAGLGGAAVATAVAAVGLVVFSAKLLVSAASVAVLSVASIALGMSE